MASERTKELYQITNSRVEDLVDEMLAILSDRDAVIQKRI